MYRYLTFGLLIPLFSTSLAVTAYSGQLEDANAAYIRGDYATAFRLTKPLAEQGIAKAQNRLGYLYYQGLGGVPQDYVLAHMWYNLAASRLPSDGRRDLYVRNRDSVASKMTPAQIAEAERLAREWKPKKEGR
ncbi:MAG: SEL1-like repeat protein [Deltaproteobacteria bacterium]|nr:SEL1-like repeat protein [Deltaproteobacteria bacterium]